MHASLSALALAAALVAPAPADEVIDHETIARIKMEGFQSSQVMEILFQLTDVHGPRLHGSENYDNMDVYDHLREEDLKQAAVIVASVAYLTAMRDQKLPRKPLPRPRNPAPQARP